MSDRTPSPWTVSEARSVEGDYLVVGGHGQEFGLIAACTLKADAEFIATAGSVAPALDAAEIERLFQGHGIAIRERTDPPIPGEPFMSIASAKDILRNALAHSFAAQARPVPDVGEIARECRNEAARDDHRGAGLILRSAADTIERLSAWKAEAIRANELINNQDKDIDCLESRLTEAKAVIDICMALAVRHDDEKALDAIRRFYGRDYQRPEGER